MGIFKEAKKKKKQNQKKKNGKDIKTGLKFVKFVKPRHRNLFTVKVLNDWCRFYTRVSVTFEIYNHLWNTINVNLRVIQWKTMPVR